MRSRSSIAYSAMTATEGTAVIKLGHGEWEINTLSVIMGSTIATLNGIEIGEGMVVFEKLLGDEETVNETHHLMVGRFTRNHPMVLFGVKRVHGPGQIKSYINHGNDSAYDHTLAVIYRRVRIETE